MNHGTESRISQVISARTIKELHYEASVEREIGVLRVLAHAGIARLVSCFRFMDGVCLTRVASLHRCMRTCACIAWRRECARNTLVGMHASHATHTCMRSRAGAYLVLEYCGKGDLHTQARPLCAFPRRAVPGRVPAGCGRIRCYL